MGKVGARITMSLDGYVAGPNDGPGRGLGEGGERMHCWVFGGPWSYEEPPTGEATGVDKELLDELVVSVAPVVLGSGKRLFEGFDKDVELEQVGVVQSPWVTHPRYRVLPA